MQAVPRYPSNVYYNASRQAQQLDEYNWIYTSPAGGGNCTPIPNVTTCRSTKATWAQYVASENGVMFRHVVDNDPRPHYIHQSNLADYNPALPETDPGQGGIAYPVFGGLLARYEARVRPHHGAADLAHAHADRPDARAAGRVGGDAGRREGHGVGGRRQGPRQERRHNARPTCRSRAPTPASLYGGEKSGWITVAAGAEQVLAPAEPLAIGRPADRHRAERRRDDHQPGLEPAPPPRRSRRQAARDAPDADQAQDVAAQVRGLAQAQAARHAAGRLADHVQGHTTARSG